MTLHVGIDEAGLGPFLGPLGLGMITAEDLAYESFAQSLRRIGVGDSKQIHKPGNLAPLETVSLLLTEMILGTTPASAAEFFSLLDESPAVRDGCPWMQGAESINLPLAAKKLPASTDDYAGMASLHGRLVHPATFNEHYATGLNRSAVELLFIKELLRELPDVACSISVDRLGGRKFYAEWLQEVWPDITFEEISEDKGVSSYTFTRQAGSPTSSIRFLVNGECHSPLVAAASCIAKYGRELHMHLLNQYWSGRFRWLKPTAGYPQDAKRWLFQLGDGNRNAYTNELIRGQLSL